MADPYFALACRTGRRSLILMLAACFLSSETYGQGRGPAPHERLPVSADEILDRLFGEQTEAERKRLEQVRISPREESQVGAAAVNAFVARLKQRSIPVQTRGSDVRYVQRLVAEIRPLMKNARRYRNIRVLLADTEATDARSFPGGTIVVSRGLIEFCESEAALVGVLGHELSHIDHGHQLDHLRRFKLAEKSFTGRIDLDRLLATGSMLARMFTRPYRPEEELQADADGARWAFELGYDPGELATVFLRAHERDRDRPNHMPPFLQSHPYHEDRYRAIVKQAESLAEQQPDVELYIGRTNLEKRVPRAQQAFAD